MFPRLAPPTASRPPPSEWRRSSSTASLPWLETIVRPLSFSYQRKAGMSSLLPSSSPAWLAPVWEERSHSQGTIRWLPSSSQRAIVGACPSRSARCSTGSARPSISNRITPGTSVRLADSAGPPADHAQLAGVVVEAEGGGEHQQTDGEDEGHQHGSQEVRGATRRRP